MEEESFHFTFNLEIYVCVKIGPRKLNRYVSLIITTDVHSYCGSDVLLDTESGMQYIDTHLRLR